MRRFVGIAALLAACGREVPQVVDRDGDTILDVHEGEADLDGDGLANADDDDADGDGYLDAAEAGDADPLTPPVDHDADGVADFLDLDADNDGLADIDDDHPPGDVDNDGVPDPSDLDDDGDGLTDAIEVLPGRPDTDDDGTPDVRDLDSDDDGVADAAEHEHGVAIDSDGDGAPDFRDRDSDDDGVIDDVADLVDADGDGLDDLRDDDDDGDGVADVDEYARGTGSKQPDTDGDGASDGAERAGGSDPNDPADTVRVIVVPWRAEVTATVARTAALARPDIALLVDTSCGMSGSLTAVKALLDDVIDLAAATPDAAVGVGTFEDYTFAPPAYTRPFTVASPVSTAFGDARAAVAALSIGSGTDGPSSGFEAMYQAVTGEGYDSACDGTYDPRADVAPFRPAPDDAFGGTADAWDGPTEGFGGGLGYRGDGSVPFVVLVTNRASRDAASLDPELATTPGGCPRDAALADVAAAFVAAGAVPFVAAPSASPGGGAPAGYADLAAAASDGLGGDLPLVFTFDATAGASGVVSGLADAIAAYAVPASITEAALRLDDDPGGFVVDLGGALPATADPRGPYTFDVRLTGVVPAARDAQAFPVRLTLVGDGWELGDASFVVVVPP